MTVRTLLVLLLLLVPVAAGAAEDRPASLLVDLVDLPTQKARGKQAAKLAGRKGISLETWLEHCRTFGRPRRHPAGAHDHTVELPVQGTLEKALITVYVPESYKRERPAPLLMAFHGSGGDGRELWNAWRGVADQVGMIVVAPTDRRGVGGWTMGAAEREAAWAALRWTRRTFNVDEARVHATGISRGGHLVWDLALRQPDRFASIAPMIGGPLVSIARGRNNLRYVENLVHVPIRDLQGSKDDPRLVANVRLTFQRLKALGAEDAELLEFPDLGHGFRMEEVDWRKLYDELRRPAIPKRAIRRSARKGEVRSGWIEILDTKSPTKEVFGLKFDPRRWRHLTPDRQREAVALEAEKRTARVEARMLAPGRFELRTKGVKTVRLLLTRGMFVDGKPVELTVDGKARKVRVKLSKQVLLAEFAERFDRTFLPVAEILMRP